MRVIVATARIAVSALCGEKGKTMSKYIEKDLVQQTAVLALTHNWTMNQIYTALMILPSADVAPVRHGRWIEYSENKDGTHNIFCSVCDGFLKSKGHANSCYTRNKYRYCHNCGARMDKEDTEQ
jgi:hypothetical protein